MTNAEEKARLREQMLKQRMKRSDQDTGRLNEQIPELAKREIQKNDCEVILLYSSTAFEIDTHRIIDFALNIGKIVCIPKCESRGVMEAHQIQSRADLKEQRFGIAEPHRDCARVLPERIDLVLAPCLCVDREGYRLGYGGGYYDRFLLRAANAKVVALCAEACILPTVYREKHDIRCDAILTESGVIRIEK